MARIVAISNQKGGVGKTTMSVNLGKNLSRRGYRILMIDNDPQGNLSLALVGDQRPDLIAAAAGSGPGPAHAYHLFIEGAGATPLTVQDRLDLIGSSKHLLEISTKPYEVVFEFREKVQAFREHYDFIMIDCLPSGGTLQAAAHITADYLLIPTHLDDFSVTGLREQLKMANNVKRRLNHNLTFLGIVANQVSTRRILVEEHYLTQLRDAYQEHLFHTTIAKSVKVQESHALRRSIAEYRRQSRVAQNYDALTHEFLARVGVTDGE